MCTAVGNKTELPRTNRKAPKTISDEFSRGEIEDLIKQGRISREGAWYRINDIKVLSNDFSGLIKRMSVSNQELLVQLYS